MTKKNLFWSLALVLAAALTFTACETSETPAEEAPADASMEAPAAPAPEQPVDATMEAPAEGGEHPADHEHPAN